MCIEQIKAWSHGGKLFATESEAVAAALDDLGARLMREHSNNIVDGLLANAESIKKLLAHHERLHPSAAKPLEMAR